MPDQDQAQVQGVPAGLIGTPINPPQANAAPPVQGVPPGLIGTPIQASASPVTGSTPASTTPTTPLTPQQIHDNAIGSAIDAGGSMNLLGLPTGSVMTGLGKGAAETLHTAGAYGSKLLNYITGGRTPEISTVEPEYLQAHGGDQTIGKVGEGVLEFFAGDEVLKGLTTAEKIAKMQKVAQVMEEYPTLAKAMKVGVDTIQQGVTGAAQAAAHGANASQSIKAGATTGLTGGAFEALNAVRLAPDLPTALKKLAAMAETAGGTGIAAKGLYQALAPRREGETEDQAAQRRVEGVIQMGMGAHAVIGSAGPAKEALLGTPEERAAAKAQAKISEEGNKSYNEFKQAVPSTRGARYAENDYQTWRNYAEPHHANVEEIGTPQDIVEASDHELKGIEDKVSKLIALNPNDLITTDVLADVKAGLAKHPRGQEFVDAGLREVEGLGLDQDITTAQADEIRRTLNAENDPILQKYKYDRAKARQADPAFAARELAANSIREGLYGKLAERGIDGVDELRKDEGSITKVRNAAVKQLENGDKVVRGSADVGTMRKIAAKTATGIGTIGGGAVGGALAGTAGAIAGATTGGLLGAKVGEAIAPGDMTRSELIASSMGRKVATGAPTEPVIAPARPIAGALPETTGDTTGIHGTLGQSGTGERGTTESPVIQRPGITKSLPAAPEPRLLGPHPDASPAEEVGRQTSFTSTVPLGRQAPGGPVTDLPVIKLSKTPTEEQVDAAVSHIVKKLSNREPLTSQELETLGKANEKMGAGLKNPAMELDIPKQLLTEGATPQRLRNHEAGHVVVGSKLGLKPIEIASHLHPDNAGKGIAATARMDFSEYNDPKTGLDKTAKDLDNIIASFMAGGVAEEVMHGVPIDENEGITGDLAQVTKLLDKLGYSKEEALKKVFQGVYKARDILSKPGVSDTIQKYTKDREFGLDKTLHMSSNKLQQMLQDIEAGDKNGKSEAGDVDSGVRQSASNQGGQNDAGAKGGVSKEGSEGQVGQPSFKLKTLFDKIDRALSTSKEDRQFGDLIKQHGDEIEKWLDENPALPETEQQKEIREGLKNRQKQ